MSITDKRSQPQIKNVDILLTYIGLLCQGKTEYDAIREIFDNPVYYKFALGITREIPSAETLRQRMNTLGSSLRKQVLQANVAIFQNYCIKPSPLPNGYVPVDIDVTPFDNRTLSINKNYARESGQDLILTPKTKKSMRIITLPNFICNLIQEYTSHLYDYHNEERLFTVTKHYLYHEMNRGCKNANVKKIRIHDLRHSHSSLLIETISYF